MFRQIAAAKSGSGSRKIERGGRGGRKRKEERIYHGRAESSARCSAATNEMYSNEDEKATHAEARKSTAEVLASDLCGLWAAVVITFLQVNCGILE